MSQWAEIRQMHVVDGVPKKQIAERLGLDIKTVRRPVAQATAPVRPTSWVRRSAARRRFRPASIREIGGPSRPSAAAARTGPSGYRPPPPCWEPRAPGPPRSPPAGGRSLRPVRVAALPVVGRHHGRYSAAQQPPEQRSVSRGHGVGLCGALTGVSNAGQHRDDDERYCSGSPHLLQTIPPPLASSRCSNSVRRSSGDSIWRRPPSSHTLFDGSQLLRAPG